MQSKPFTGNIRGVESTGFVFLKEDKFVALDAASGGYPYLTDSVIRAMVWPTIKDALRYYKHFSKEEEGWILYRLYHALEKVELTEEDLS